MSRAYDYHKIYPRSVKGMFRSLKWLASALLLLVFYAGSWLRWDRGAGAQGQAILIDLPGRRAYFFGIEIWPQEVYYLTGVLVLAALTLFFVSSLFGRLWCGFACWQTVFTDLFQAIERRIEGDRAARIALDKERWGVRKLGLKAAKHLSWLAVAVSVGVGFVLYFNDAPTTFPQIFTGKAPDGAYLFVLIIGGFCYLLAGFAREQVCIYMCPYGRFQSAMFDEHSLIVSYEAWRGEPRGHARAGEDFGGRGQCVDCGLCVQVCPTGTDIRRGTEVSCIGCGLCIDACDQVMDRFGLPRKLISWDSATNLAARAEGRRGATRIVRPRTIVYASLLTVVASIMLYMLSHRATVELNVLHERNPLFVELSDGYVRNGYTVKVINKTGTTQGYRLTVTGLPDMRLDLVGGAKGREAVEFEVEPDSVGSFQVFASAPHALLHGPRQDLVFTVTRADGAKAQAPQLFAGP